jgi:DNA modification methylase
VEIRRGHALDLIEEVPKRSLDLLATDPPYAFGGSGGEHALSATVATVLREGAYRLKPGGWAVVFAASSWRSVYYMVEATRGILDPVRVGAWHKPEIRTKVRTAGWGWATVSVLVLRRPGGDRSLYEPAGGLLDYVVAEPVRNGRRAELPESVASWAVAPYSLRGGAMLDPFAGSGALCRAAEASGMDALGFEIEAS